MLFGTFLVNAQLAIRAEPNSTNILPGIINQKGLGIRQRIITMIRGSLGTVGDTIIINFYDKKGVETNSISFQKNQRNSYTEYSWSKDRKISYWKYDLKDKPGYTSSNKTVYDKRDSILWFQNFDVLNKDTIDKPLVNFYYNDAGQLIRKKQSRKGVVYMNEDFSYSGKDMIRVEVNITGSAAITRYDYTYNQEHLPISIQESFLRGDKQEIYKTTYYQYLKGKLISKKFPDSSNPKLTVEISYSYDNQGRISTAKAKCDTLYRNVEFLYADNKLSKVKIEGNTMSKFSEVFWIYSNSYFKKKPSFIFTKDLFYDEKGALIKVVDKIDDIQDNVTKYDLTYY